LRIFQRYLKKGSYSVGTKWYDVQANTNEKN